MLTAAALGFVLGLRHAFDPDHVIAVSAIASRNRNPWKAAWIGLSWALGHSLTVLLVGALVIALRLVIPDGVARAMELGVGLLLIGLGVSNLAASRDAAATPPELPLRRALARSGAVGLAHGLAGSAAVVLLALAAMPTIGTAVVYLAVFGAGTMTGMVAFSLAVGAPFAVAHGSASLGRWVTVATGVASVAFGGWLVYHVSTTQGLA